MRRITFGLSKRQRKELTERGRTLRLVLPDDGTVPESELLEYARRVLDVPSAWVRSVATGSITVQPRLGPGTRTNSGADTYGHIVHEDSPEQPRGGAILVSVLQVELTAVDQPRGRTRWEWPGTVTLATKDQR